MGRRNTAVDRALTVLERLSAHDTAMPAGAIAKYCGIPRSSTYHLLNVLAARGFARYDPAARAWTVGRHLTEIGAAEPTLAEATAVLEAFDRASPWLSVPDLAVRTGLTVRQTQAVLDHLTDEGLVALSRDGTYGLGLRLVRLAARVERADRLRLTAHPAIVALRDATGETANLLVRDGESAVYLDQVESRRTLRVSAWLGRTIPIATTAAGAAFLGPHRVHAVSDAVEAGVTAVACSIPISGDPPAAVSVTGPTSRLKGRSLRLAREAVLKAANDVAALMQ